MPVHDPASALALSTHGSDVESVMVAGAWRMREGRLLDLDEPALLAECRAAAQALRQRAGVN
jgi:cytosine/adenosine deaminase-related metal-dependent hydrolase